MTKSANITVNPLVKKVEKQPGCIQSVLSIIGDKWSPLLIGYLVEEPKTFGELISAMPGISPRTLSARLSCLENAGIIEKQCYCQHPPRFKYCLTVKGKDLRSILTKMADWGQKYSQ